MGNMGTEGRKRGLMRASELTFTWRVPYAFRTMGMECDVEGELCGTLIHRRGGRFHHTEQIAERSGNVVGEGIELLLRVTTTQEHKRAADPLKPHISDGFLGIHPIISLSGNKQCLQLAVGGGILRMSKNDRIALCREGRARTLPRSEKRSCTHLETASPLRRDTTRAHPLRCSGCGSSGPERNNRLQTTA